MNISNWPLGRIMQLPDCCFGRRWPVACGGETVVAQGLFAVVSSGVPDRCVVHEIIVTSETTTAVLLKFEFAWADQVPASAAQWSALQKMFPCQGVQDGLDYELYSSGQGPFHLTKIRMPSPASGLRPALRVDGASTPAMSASATFVISSLPTEVPDWLVSGPGRSL